MLSDHSTATSIRMLTKFSSATAAPSTATTNVFSRNWGTYWSMPRRSVGLTRQCYPRRSPRGKERAMTHRIYVTCDIGKDALDRFRERGWEVEVYDQVQPPPKALVLEKVRSGIAALVTTLRDPIDEEIFAAGAASGLARRLPDRGGGRQHRPRGGEPPPDPLHPHPGRPHRRHRRVRLLHDGRGRAPALPGRGAGARARVDDLAPLPALARGRGDGTDAGRPRDGPDRPEHGEQGGRLRHGRAVPQHVPLRRPRWLRHRGAAGDGPPAPRGALDSQAGDRGRVAGGCPAAGRLRLPPRAPDACRGRAPSRPST